MLGIIRTIEINTLGVLAGASMVAADDEMCGAVILADDGMPDGFTGTAHAHSEWEETEDSHSIGVAREKRLVDADACEVIDVTGFCEADDGMDENVGLTLAGGTNSELTMSTMHRVPG